MAELMVAGAALGALFNVVFDKLASREVVNFIRGKKLGPLLDRMKATLTVVRFVLNDAEKRQITDSDVKDWLSELKHVVYMADDLLDQVSTKAAVAAAAATEKKVTTSKLLSCCFNAQHRRMDTRSCLFNTQDRSKIATRLEEIVAKLEHILELKERLDLKEIAMDNSSSRVPTTSVPDGKIYGRDEDKKAIIKLWSDDNNNNNNNNDGEKVSVIPIVGMGGVGKTTLAQMIYNDEDLNKKFKFELKAWVCVSEPFDIVMITKTLTEAFTKQACQINDFNSLQENLVQILRGKKFFIILDDVWNEDYDRWNQLRKPFQHGMRGSKILITTRSDEVASVVKTNQTFHLSQLSNQDCWSVFANHARLPPGSGENTRALEKIGLEIVKKCKGLPLAAQSLGGLLRRKRDIKDWNDVLNCDIWELSHSESNIIPSLRISYHYLPSYWKRCFVYCSLYPKDYEFLKNDVILLWMAEDLLPPPKKGKTLEDVGDECFNYLVSSSFLQSSSNPWKKEYYFGMHDLMHDLATFIGGEFYFRSDDLGEETKIDSKTRHLSFINFSSPNPETFGVLDSSKFLRTFLGMKQYSSDESKKVPYTKVLSLECLRVLSFCDFENFYTLPDSINRMVHLRYLDLSRTEIESLPESLCNLYNLQTLKLEFCCSLTMLPGGMQNLVNLHYLGIAGTDIEEMPKGMGKLKQLRHLPYFIVGKHEEIKIKELGGLSNLGGSLTIEKLENVENGSEALEARMMDKKHIQDLVLKWSLDVEDCKDSNTELDILCKLEPHQDLESLFIIGYRGTRYPDWVGRPAFHNMTSIKVSDCKNCFTLPSLGHLPSLKHLSISNWKMLETIDTSFFNNDTTNNDGCSLLTVVPFPSLKSLTFEDMPCWEVWSCSEQPRAFPKLKRLRIVNCPKLKGDLPSDLPALEKLRIQDCKQLACSLPRAPAMREITIIMCDDSLTSLALDTYPNLQDYPTSSDYYVGRCSRYFV
ncbi:putative disease resistance RPP13-like protein 1 [Lotus japonicus]|uniref:putative disease resistance RPP13-like protein 1 n=1 Tax=Lotus japonicus TaxID=34305 RepID=UPI00258F4F95|nr:putative disease resistance RPP13-like protein 1 [Lotus japonicus]XP_057448852.1 putative disease resistance RPP13-like protein 1 [Lotus japonicus]XP_057448853.1 putative disease resistance RPP13-like protein 1 [Lotus japonicus]XP_057448854.1 putative disease resistance RPP13-like protein 1 [Lotus japonicus]XP_057448855.1 putative disease resistance RPP13-like protein 1 [Lotus japonicus]XP_057448856.1 putative disease resistance RPP13-like protein 1 [Lotus japonicus]